MTGRPGPGEGTVFTTPSHLRAYAMAAALRDRGVDVTAAPVEGTGEPLRTTDWLRVLEGQLEAAGLIAPGELDATIDRPDKPWVVH